LVYRYSVKHLFTRWVNFILLEVFLNIWGVLVLFGPKEMFFGSLSFETRPHILPYFLMLFSEKEAGNRSPPQELEVGDAKEVF